MGKKRVDHRTAYKEGTVKWWMCNNDLHDKSIEDIARMLNFKVSSVYAIMRVIRKETGYQVKYNTG